MKNKTLEDKPTKNNICLFQDDVIVKKLIQGLSKELGFPRVKRVLTLYFGKNIKLSCDENSLKLGRLVHFKSIETWREIRLKSKYLGTLLDILYDAGLKKAAIGNVIQLTFPTQSDYSVIYLSDTLISEHQFEIRCYENTKFKSKTIQTILKNKIDRNDLVNRTSKIAEENIFDSLRVLNEKIINYCKQSNISLSMSANTSYFHQINSTSNDYGDFATVYELITGKKLVDRIPTQATFTPDLPSVSIIIPAYNLNDSFIKTLLSIDNQNPKNIKFEVIIIDDGSKKSVVEIVNKIGKSLCYEPIVIRKEKNSGISQTRNIGAAIAKNDILLFIDGDIVLTPNYLYEHLLRHKLLNKSILVSFKENVDINDNRISPEAIKEGVVTPDYWNDLRITKYIDKDAMGYHARNYLAEGDIFSILSETNYFRNLGFGRRFGKFDLPSMVIGHNLSMPSNFFRSIGGFDNNIIGYGLEDALIGMKAIAAGAFVVPVLACGVYHINHETRRGTTSEIRKEFEENSEIIANFLSSQE